MNLTKSERTVYDLLLSEYSKKDIKRGKQGEPDFILPDKCIEVKTTRNNHITLTFLQSRNFKGYKNLYFWIFLNGNLIKVKYSEAKKSFKFETTEHIIRTISINEINYWKLKAKMVELKVNTYDKLLAKIL